MWEVILLALLRYLQPQRAEAIQHARESVYYRTKDGRADYVFTIEQQPGGDYRVYLALQPERSLSYTTHLLTDRQGRRFICWTRSIRTLTDARRVAAAWADNTQRYSRTGVSF